MAVMFGSIQADVLIAFMLGLAGGIAAELIDNKGSIGLCFFEKDDKGQSTHKLNMGFLAKLLVGGVAALAFLFLIDTTEPLKFVGAAVVAGFGGSATLVAVKEKVLGGQKDTLMEQQTNNARQLAEENKAQVSAAATRGFTGVSTEKVDAVLASVEKTNEQYKKLR